LFVIEGKLYDVRPGTFMGGNPSSVIDTAQYLLLTNDSMNWWRGEKFTEYKKSQLASTRTLKAPLADIFWGFISD